jgi:hypothetical protein
MAKRGSIGGIGRLVFGVIGLGLAVLAIVIWLTYLVNPARALAQGDKLTVTVTRCEGSSIDKTCYAQWFGGSGKLDGHADPGTKVVARVFDGKAYPTKLEDWYPRLILGLVGLAAAVLAQFLIRSALRMKK